MSRPALAPGVYGFDDLGDGDWLQTATVEVTAEAIDSFAALTGDRFEIHMDTDAARAQGFEDRVAHGLLVLSLVDGLKNQAEVQFRALVSLGWDWSFRRPVLSGDTLSVRITVLEKRPTRRTDRGILRLGFDVRNGSGDTVNDGTNLLMVRR